MTIFVDTSALYAILDSDDEKHRQASQVWLDLIKQKELLVSNNYVLLETLVLLQHRLGINAIRAFQQSIAPELYVEWFGESEHQAAAEALLIAARHKLSLVDCSSFGTMNRFTIRAAFAFDRHFTEQGFECIPRVPE
jgi:predicted nucleic acid-binding protein